MVDQAHVAEEDSPKSQLLNTNLKYFTRPAGQAVAPETITKVPHTTTVAAPTNLPPPNSPRRTRLRGWLPRLPEQCQGLLLLRSTLLGLMGCLVRCAGVGVPPGMASRFDGLSWAHLTTYPRDTVVPNLPLLSSYIIVFISGRASAHIACGVA